LVGAGRAGRALGRALRAKGWRVHVVVTRSAATAREAVRAVGGGVPSGKIIADIFDADLILLATPDGALESVAAELARVGGKLCRGRIVLHTSGALDRGVLAPLRKCGAATGSAHPMQTFGGKRVPNLRGVLFGIEGDPRALKMARRMARELGGIPIVVPAGRKVVYHAAAVMVAGLGMGLLEAAVQVLMSAGFTRQRATQSLWLLMRQMLDDAERLSPRKAWAGPLLREDFGVIAAHWKALREFSPEIRGTYAALARVAARTLSAEPDRVMRELEAVLSNGRRRKRGRN
jgi:predicted short-subunit dehydrogenase-like oxidoreductase (DUF2520 family)